MAIQLDLSSLENALKRLDEALQANATEPQNSLYRDACIQRFEFCYELSHKMLKRYLELASPNPAEIDELAFPDLIRTGSEQGLLRNGWDIWKNYRQARSITSHTYDESKAIAVMQIIPDFLLEGQALHKELSQRTKG
ncbi:nucleotidyltransferase substrate binding protein [Undibacterium seohonense]|uniref:Nucleotidyltransferase substrate binding protein n=1 Tax=Undibacterium seohonense TaxID=1344950 RepID=A0ABR6WZU5_9BURK|nr:nucleotidyltransferase substrate binding protein [Undibacterium seohonense]MBC3806169.1 nucleotidyltransferase substrate binding protein [Undibacterium seohonense]